MALHEIDSDLQTAEKTLHHWETTYPGLIRAEANAKIEYEMAIARVVDEISKREGKQPTVAVMEAEATLRCAKEIKQRRLAEAEAEIGKKLIGIAETTLSSVQSRLKLAQIEAGLSGMRS